MNERDRLIELLSQYFNIGDSYAYNLTRVKSAFGVGTVSVDDFEEFDDDTIAELADHLLANGVIVPPVKVGQTVYINGLMGFGEAEAHKITHAQCRIGSAGQSWFFEAWLIGGRGDCGFWDDQIGKTVFLTREEAEQALKESEQK